MKTEQCIDERRKQQGSHFSTYNPKSAYFQLILGFKREE